MADFRAIHGVVYGVLSIAFAFFLIVSPAAAETLCGLMAVGVPDHDVGSEEDAGGVSVLHSFEGIGLETTADKFFTQNSYDFDSSSEENDSFGRSIVVADFNGDHYTDIAIGVPWQDIGGKSGAGAVQVVYGTFLGFLAYTTDFVHHNAAGIAGSACIRGQFGAALAAGDFNGDGYDDLAIGSPEYYLSDQVGDSGAVNIVYGSPGGVSSIGNQIWTQDSTGILDQAEDGDRFGAALAAGDFDGDGYDDLAIGVPWERVGTEYEAGAVNVIYGRSGGLNAYRDQFWTQGANLYEQPNDYDHFGAALAAGDFNGDGKSDLAIGVPDEGSAGNQEHGVVHMLCGWGAELGLVDWNDQLWSQDTPGMLDEAEDDDRFGYSLATGDFNGDGYDDLAVGAPFEDIFDDQPSLYHYQAGVVHIIRGSSTWLDVAGNRQLHQDIAGVQEQAADYEYFGTSISAADLDCDGYADLVVGVPEENPDGVIDAGVVQAFYGRPTGVSTIDDQVWHLGTPGVEGVLQEDAAFGSTVAVGNVSLLFVDGFEHDNTNRWDDEMN